MSAATDSPQAPLHSILDHVHGIVLATVAAAAWLALVSAHAGRFSATAAIAGGAAAGLGMLARGAWTHRRRRTRPEVSRWDVATLVLIAVLVARSFPANTPWIAFLDASWYAGTAARIARDGGLAFESDALAEAPAAVRPALVATFRDERSVGLPFPDDPGRGFHAVIFADRDTATAVVGPYHPPLYAAGLAVAAKARGPLRSGDGTLAWSLAWLLGVAAVARAAFGSRAALLATGAAGLGPAFGYYAANPYAEMAAGALALGGVRALIALAGRVGTAATAGSPAPWAALGAGLGLGLACLTKVDLIPTAAAAGLWWWHARRSRGGVREGAALALGFGLPAVHGLWLVGTVSNLYVALNGGGVVDRWRPGAGWSVLVAIAAIAAVAVVVIAATWRRRRHIVGDLDRPEVRRGVATIAVLALGLAFAVAWLGSESAPPAPIAILAWLMTPLGVWAAAAGLVGCLDRGDARAGPLVALALVVVPVLLIDPVVSEGLSPLYTARRLVPMAVPLVAILASAAAVKSPHARLVVAGAALIFVAQIQAARPFTGSGARDFAGGPRLAQTIASHAGPRDVLVFTSTLDGTVAGRLASAVWTLEGREVVVLGNPEVDGAALAAAVDAWRANGRNVLWVDDGRVPGPDLPGYTLVEVGTESIISQAPAPSPDLPPRMAPLPIEVRVRAVEPVDGDAADPNSP